jgi:hypothetical protein
MTIEGNGHQAAIRMFTRLTARWAARGRLPLSPADAAAQRARTAALAASAANNLPRPVRRETMHGRGLAPLVAAEPAR